MIKFGTLGAADITPVALVHPCASEPMATINVIAARDKLNAQGFARYHKIPTVVDSYEQVIGHAECNAIYNPLPISHHLEWTIKALEAGKHVLCEKSLACNAQQARQMQEAAQTSGLILMDAFHYRYHPLFARARDIYLSGQLGDIKTLEATFAIPNTPAADDIRMNFETAGGVTMDIGCYPISWLRHLTGQEPTVTSARAELGPPNVDLMLEADMVFPGEIAAKITGDMRNTGKFTAEIIVTGSLGSMTVKNPLAPQMGHVLETNIDGNRQFTKVDRRPTYSYQLDAFIQAVNSGQAPITDGVDAVKQMQVIDDCYRAAGLPLRGNS